MENAESRLLQRYFRKTIAHPDGSVCHHGDCNFFSVWICTCGLLHDLAPLSPALVEQHYSQFQEEKAEHDRACTDLTIKRKPHKSRKH